MHQTHETALAILSAHGCTIAFRTRCSYRGTALARCPSPPHVRGDVPNSSYICPSWAPPFTPVWHSPHVLEARHTPLLEAEREHVRSTVLATRATPFHPPPRSPPFLSFAPPSSSSSTLRCTGFLFCRTGATPVPLSPPSLCDVSEFTSGMNPLTHLGLSQVSQAGKACTDHGLSAIP